MKNKTAGAAYKAARGNLLAMLVLTAVNTILALTGSDRYYLFTDFAAYIWAVFARGFYDFTGEAKWLVLGAAGAVELIASALALQNGVIPPTIGLEQPDPDCDLNYTPLVAQEAQADVAVSLSLGFGGHNGAVVLRRAED